MSDITKNIKVHVEESGYMLVSSSVVSEKHLMAIALELGYGLYMEPWSLRRHGSDHPMLFKDASNQVLSMQIKEIRQLRAKIAELKTQLAAKESQ